MQLIKSFTLAILINFLAAAAGFAGNFKTPEDAINAYIEGVKKQDFEEIIGATAADSMSKGFNFVAEVDRLQKLSLLTPVPSSSALFVALNKAEFVARVARDVQRLSYGLLIKAEAETKILEGHQIEMDASSAANFASSVDTQRLSDLKLLKVGIPNPEMVNSEKYRSAATRRAKVFGADNFSERLALLSFEGHSFAIGFTVLRYEESWSVLDLYSQVTRFGRELKRVTPEQFEDLIH